MAENCDHNCGSCGQNCADRDPRSFLAAPHAKTHVKNVIGIVSGKGGVGKSLVTSLLACAAAKKGLKVGILDADITGPSIPRMFGIDGTYASGNDDGLLPSATKAGVDVMSINLLLEDSEEPVIWRGPVIAGAVKQFWTDVVWGDLDYLFVDMPPGTGDVPLTVFQSIPVSGIVIVTSPQELVSLIVGKAVRMATAMSIPVLGIVENMSCIVCPDCGKKIPIFGESKTESVAAKYDIRHTASLPIRPEIARLCDEGKIEEAPEEVLEEMGAFLLSLKV
ncbi:MAG: Mrp/NBP35 family ATP-binding protein [Lachnospiraceae bacterium]|nr:Mrp/NBP35 family ATP-binding protein [Lachnospiraceae bacterium]